MVSGVSIQLSQPACLVQGPSERLSENKVGGFWGTTPNVDLCLHTHVQTCDMQQHRLTHRVGEEGGREEGTGRTWDQGPWSQQGAGGLDIDEEASDQRHLIWGTVMNRTIGVFVLHVVLCWSCAILFLVVLGIEFRALYILSKSSSGFLQPLLWFSKELIPDFIQLYCPIHSLNDILLCLPTRLATFMFTPSSGARQLVISH